MKSARNIYLVAMCVAGIVLGVLGIAVPILAQGFATPFTILLVVSLVVDVALMRLVRDVVPLSMESRFAGFFSGMILFLLVTFLFGQGISTA